MSEKPRLNCSNVGTFLHCRMKYFWQRVEGLYPKQRPSYLMVGDFVHRLLSYQIQGKLTIDHIKDLDKIVEWAYPNEEVEIAYEVAEEAARLVLGWINRWSTDDPLEFVASEVHVETEEPNFFLYGRIDGLARTQDGSLWRHEFKTSSRMDSAFLKGQKLSLQTGIYGHLLNECLKEPTKGTIFDILVKTKIPQYARPPVLHSKKVTKRALEVFEGVARSIKRGDFYPSGQCFTYNRECEYLVLCNNDSKENREAFFETGKRKSMDPKNHTLDLFKV